MWHIISCKTSTDYLVVHETKGCTDYILRTSVGDCWSSDLIYDIIDIDDSPEMLDHILGKYGYYILYSFESDGPIKFLQTIRETNPEIFI